MTLPARRDAVAWGALVALVALVAAAASLANGYTQDDIPIIVENPRLHSLGGLWHRFAESYWPPEVTAVLYRPLSMVAFTLQWAVGKGEPWAFHLTSVALLAVTSVVLYLLFLELLEPAAAGAAGLLLAAHPVHTEAVAGVVGQSELWVVLFLGWASLLYVRGRKALRISIGRWTAIAALGACAILTKENGAILVGLLLALEISVVTDRRPLATRLGRLWPGYLALILVVAGDLAVRLAVLGDLVGEVPRTSLRGAGFGARALTMLAVVPEWMRLLFLPVHLQADYMPQELGLATGFGLAQLVGLVFLAAAGWLAWRTRRSAPVVLLGLCWMGVALFPVSNLAVRTGILLAERTLFVASIGAVLVAAGLADWRLRVGPVPARHERLVAWAAFALLVVAATAWSSARQRVWKDNATLYAQTVVDAPLSYRARWAQAGMLYQAGNLKEAEIEYRLALKLYDQDPNLLEDYADRFIEHGRCGDALPWLRRSLEQAPAKWKARGKVILCLIEVDSVAAAQAELATKRERKDPDAAFLTNVVDSLLRNRPR